MNRAVGSLGVAVTVLVAGCSGAADRPAGAQTEQTPTAQRTIPQPAVTDLEVAAEGDRVDLTVPEFSESTKITNPLFPVEKGGSSLLLGTVDDLPFRAEVTVLPHRRLIEWEGQQVAAVVSQYAAFLDGRIHEVALDLYAQADDGSVWYLGEDVFNYEDGLVADTEGTWFAGTDGPAGMIMPSRPRVGDVYRPENIPGVVFEEVTVESAGETVEGPRGTLEGAVVMRELHMEGDVEQKTFAPGYGEFYTGAGGDVEALALAVPTDSLDGPTPASLTALADSATAAFDVSSSGHRRALTRSVRAATVSWQRYRQTPVPKLVDSAMTEALTRLADADGAADAARWAIEVSRLCLDLRLRHDEVTAVDLARTELWARQLMADLAAGDRAAIDGDLAMLDWMHQRYIGVLTSVDVSRIDVLLGRLRAAAQADAVDDAARVDDRLRELVARLAPERSR